MWLEIKSHNERMQNLPTIMYNSCVRIYRLQMKAMSSREDIQDSLAKSQAANVKIKRRAIMLEYSIFKLYLNNASARVHTDSTLEKRVTSRKTAYLSDNIGLGIMSSRRPRPRNKIRISTGIICGHHDPIRFRCRSLSRPSRVCA